MEEYYQVKRRLFNGEMGSRPEKIVINRDCPYGRRLIEDLGNEVEVLSFSLEDEATFRASAIEFKGAGTEFTLTWPEGTSRIVCPLLGRYNVSNLLAALAVAYAQNFDLKKCFERMASFDGVPGRMERIDAGQPYNVLVDYAHTDDALRNATEMLREITEGRVITVFGCGGDRDRTKRAPMLRAALEGSDVVIATADNPRTEAISQIFDDMRAAENSDEVSFIEDRKDAISRAFDLAEPKDCILIAGKGHEVYQESGGTVVPFDDRVVARELIRLKQG